MYLEKIICLEIKKKKKNLIKKSTYQEEFNRIDNIIKNINSIKDRLKKKEQSSLDKTNEINNYETIYYKLKNISYNNQTTQQQTQSSQQKQKNNAIKLLQYYKTLIKAKVASELSMFLDKDHAKWLKNYHESITKMIMISKDNGWESLENFARVHSINSAYLLMKQYIDHQGKKKVKKARELYDEVEESYNYVKEYLEKQKKYLKKIREESEKRKKESINEKNNNLNVINYISIENLLTKIESYHDIFIDYCKNTKALKILKLNMEDVGNKRINKSMIQ